MRSLFASLGLVIAFEVVGCSGSEGGGSSAAADAHGVGAPCRGSADCAAPLFCNSDPVKHLLDQQCTAACDSAEPCDTFGSSAGCLGANLCAHACASNADCPAGTACNSYMWCERVAPPPSSTNLRCAGKALGCAAVKGTGANCSDVPGCSSKDLCVGKPASCYSQGLGCNSVHGCVYDIDLEGCTGEPGPCSGYSGHYYCNNTIGCSWDYECIGTPRPCELLTAAVCELQPGCFLQ